MDDTEKSNANQSSSGIQSGRIIPEEVSADVQRPEDISSSKPPDFPTEIPVYQEKNNKWTFVIVILIFFLVIFGLIYWFFLRSLITPKNQSADIGSAEITIKYWGLWEDKSVFQPVIDTYQQKNPKIKIIYEKMSPQQYRDRLIARSKTGNGPDIFRYHNTWIPQLKDIITPLPMDIMSSDEFKSTFYPIHDKDLNVNNQYYGIPLMIDGMVLIYNEDLLKQAGLNDPPQTWLGDSNDVFSAIKALTVLDATRSIITSGLAIGTATNIDHFGEIYGILLLLNGGNLKDLATKEASEALELYRKFAEDGFWNETMPSSTTAFIQGKAAMIFGPSWQILNIKSQNPELNVKATTIPKGLNNSEKSIASYWVEGVNKYSKNQAEAWKFLKFLSEKEQLLKINEMQTKIRPFGTAYPRRDMASLLQDNPYLYSVVRQAEGDVFVSLPICDKTLDGGINEEILKYLEDAITSTSNGVHYSSALDTAKNGITNVLSRYQIE